jgi:hypothetical protein
MDPKAALQLAQFLGAEGGGIGMGAAVHPLRFALKIARALIKSTAAAQGES